MGWKYDFSSFETITFAEAVLRLNKRSRPRRDLTGQRFGKLLVEGVVLGHGTFRWRCQCDCGKKSEPATEGLVSGNSTSCGCMAPAKAKGKRKEHGLVNSKIYEVYHSMRQRCNNSNSQMYHHYGGRGIKVCPRWEESFENFLADMGTPPEGWHLDRIDNDGDYSPENCRWATRKQNARNRRTNVLIEYMGETRCIKEWSEVTGIPTDRLYKRVRSGLDLDRVFEKARLVGKRNG